MNYFICVTDLQKTIRVLELSTVSNVVFHKKGEDHIAMVVEYTDGREFTLWNISQVAYEKVLGKLEGC